MIGVALANRVLVDLNPMVWFHSGDSSISTRSSLSPRRIRFSEPVNGRVENTEQVFWVAVPRLERLTHFTAWDGDLFLFDGTVTVEVIYAGDNVVLDPGVMVAYFPVR